MAKSQHLLLVTALVALGCGDDTSSGSGSGASASTGGESAGGSATGAGSSAGGNGTGAGSSAGGAAPGMCDGGPLAAPIAGCAPAPPPSSGDPHQDCVDRINQLRWECQCLPPLARWNDAESCTDTQSADDQSSGQAHGNFGACNEFAQNTCPDWPSQSDVIGGCLQMMWDEGPGDFNSGHGHYINMSSTDYTKVACGFSSGNGGVWSNQNFSP